MTKLYAGIGRANITPPIGIAMDGFAGRGPVEDVHDDLLVTTLALQSGDKRVMVVTADLLGLEPAMVADVRHEISLATGVAVEHILLCASHTHYGPVITECTGLRYAADIATRYRANLKYLIAGTAIRALANTQPVSVGVAKGSCSIGINRRERLADGTIALGNNPNGPCDNEVIAIRIDTEAGEPLAVIANVACHPVSAHGGMRQVSADYIGVMRDLVEQTTGATCLFVQGAAGDINPITMRHSFDPAWHLGTLLGCEVVRLYRDIAPREAGSLAFATEDVRLPAKTYSTAAEAEEEVGILRAGAKQARSDGEKFWSGLRLSQAERMRDSILTGIPLPPVTAEVNVVRFGDAALVTAPGEIFNEIGMAVKLQSTVPGTCYVGYTNGRIDYVPVREAYAEGGYEVTHLCHVGPDAASLLEAASVRLLNEVA